MRMETTAQFKNGADQMTKADGLFALHPELHPYVWRTKLGYVLSSPWVAVPQIHEGTGIGSVPWINKVYTANKKHAEGLLANGDWDGYILLTRKPFRIHSFNEVQSRLTDPEYWTLLNEVWTDSETLWRNNELWLRALAERPATRHLFMTPEDRTVYASLPESFTIYRGYQPRKNRDGFSWTLDRDVAGKLSNLGKGTNLFDMQVQLKGGKLREKTVNKSEVFAYTNSREEQEIILLWDGSRYVRPSDRDPGNGSMSFGGIGFEETAHLCEQAKLGSVPGSTQNLNHLGE